MMIPECRWGDQNQNQTQSEGINGMAGSLFSVLLLVGKGLSRWLFGDLRSHPSSKTRKRKTDGDSSPGRADTQARISHHMQPWVYSVTGDGSARVQRTCVGWLRTFREVAGKMRSRLDGRCGSVWIGLE